MKILKVVIIVGILLMIVSTITGIGAISFSTDGGMTFERLESSWRLIINVFCAIGLSIWLYLIHDRKMSAWWIGTVLYFGAIINCLYVAFSATLHKTGMQMTINFIANIFLAFLLYVFFKKWWIKKKKTYFTV